MLLTTGIDRWLASAAVPASLAHDVRRAADAAANALLQLAELLSVSATREDGYGIGEDLTLLLLEGGHCCPAMPEDLATDAHTQFELERRRLDEMIKSYGCSTWHDVQQRLSESHPEPDEYYRAFGETWRACRTLAVRQNLVTWPEEWGLRYVPIPEWTRQAAPYLYYLFYRSPAPFDRVAIHDYVVPSIEAVDDEQAEEKLLRAWNDAAIKLNHVVHHGAIGHHVQNWYAYRAPSRIAQIAAVDCATRIGMFCGGSMAEGWACYATELMQEAGFLTELEQIAEQHTRVRLMTRAIVDLGLHAGRLTFARAVSTFQNACGMPQEQARAEVTKASMFPGTGLMYWLGLDGLQRLRQSHEAALGARFNLRAFHDELLGLGSLPVPLIARLMPAPALT
jgi:hypothetical protein